MQPCVHCSISHNSPDTETTPRTSLVVQWLRIYLSMQGTRVQSLVQEDSTCHGELSLCTTTTETHEL